MGFEKFDRSKIRQGSLSERKNKVVIADIYVKTDDSAPELPDDRKLAVSRLAGYIIDARMSGRSVMLSFGAHSIKNGLGPLMVKFLERGWITHLATNGAGIIHDWEFAFQGESSESVADNLPKGQFGIWDETGAYLNLAITAGAYQGLGYGAAVGKAISEQGIAVPSEDELTSLIDDPGAELWKRSAAADLLKATRKTGRDVVKDGVIPMPAPYADYSLQAGAWRLGVASTDHPMFGHDIIYTHDLCNGGAIGRAAQRDFQSFVDSASRLDGGVYLSLGSAIMSPMVFEKACELLWNNVDDVPRRTHIAVVDLASPEKCSPSIRKFAECGPETLDFFTMDNRAFLLALYQELDRRGQDFPVAKKREPLSIPVMVSRTSPDVKQTAMDILEAKERGASRMLTFGTDLIRNGLAPLVSEFLRRGWISHLATTGTSAVDDWEMAALGAVSAKLCDPLSSRNVNLAVLAGAFKGKGLGESLANAISDSGIVLPDIAELESYVSGHDDHARTSAAAELLDIMSRHGIPGGKLAMSFPFAAGSLMKSALDEGIPFTVHPMFGLDDPFLDPLCSFAAVGRCAETDFLYFAHNVSRLDGGIYMSVGSSVASPMIFEKALSMSQNVLLQQGAPMTGHKIVVVDLAESSWDWMHNGEPPETRPEYYLRYCKSFSRAKAASMRYVSADNRDFFKALYQELISLTK